MKTKRMKIRILVLPLLLQILLSILAASAFAQVPNKTNQEEGLLGRIWKSLSLEEIKTYGKQLIEEHTTPLSKEDQDKKKKIDSLIKYFDQEMIFYSWQNEDQGKIYLKEKSFGIKRALINKYIGWPKIHVTKRRAGRGFYVSQNYYDSSSYADDGSGKEGSLVEIHIPKGTPYIDLTTDEARLELRKLGLEKDDIFRLDPKAVVRYSLDPNWWVMKTFSGATFSPFTAKEIPTQSLLKNRIRISPAASNVWKTEVNKILKSRVIDPHQKTLEDEYQLCQKKFQKIPLVGGKIGEIATNNPLKTLIGGLWGKTTFLWRHDGSCGEYSEQYPRKLIRGDVDQNLCRKAQGSSYQWVPLRHCQEVVDAEQFSFVVVDANAAKENCTRVEWSPEGKCFELRSSAAEKVEVSTKICEAALGYFEDEVSVGSLFP